MSKLMACTGELSFQPAISPVCAITAVTHGFRNSATHTLSWILSDRAVDLMREACSDWQLEVRSPHCLALLPETGRNCSGSPTPFSLPLSAPPPSPSMHGHKSQTMDSGRFATIYRFAFWICRDAGKRNIPVGLHASFACSCCLVGDSQGMHIGWGVVHAHELR